MKRINWDYIYTVSEQENILASNDMHTKLHLYLKLLTSVRWYNLKAILTENELREILSEDVVNRLFPPSMRDPYHYARHVLFG